MTFLLPCKQLRLALFTENEIRRLRCYVRELKLVDMDGWSFNERLRAGQEIIRIERKIAQIERWGQWKYVEPFMIMEYTVIERKAVREITMFPGTWIGARGRITKAIEIDA